MVFYWLFGYKTDDDTEEKPKEDNDGDLSNIPPPPVLTRQQGYYKECKNDDIIKWKDYDKELQEIREEIKKIKIDSDEKWKARLSPVLHTKSVRKKRRKNSSNAVKPEK
jgi:hypothetical protein